jgi:hypothetical protein
LQQRPVSVDPLKLPTGHTLVESMLFPSYFNYITLNQSEIDVEIDICAQWVTTDANHFSINIGKSRKMENNTRVE